MKSQKITNYIDVMKDFQKDEPDEFADYLISDDKNLPIDVVFQRNTDVKHEFVKKNEKKEDQIHKWEPFSPKRDCYEICFRESPVIRYVSKPKKHLIKVEPNQIVFTSYDRGCVYQEIMWVQNIGKSVARIQILPFKETSKFKLQWSKKLGGIIAIASGLSITAKVEFHCKSLDDVTDELVLKVEGGKDIIVPIIAKRLPPILEALEPEITYDLVLWSLEKRGVEATLDCGVALVGDSVLHTINLFNDGGDGSFWIMTEEEWIHCEVKCGSLNNVLKIPPFLFTPFYFALKSKEEITLCVLYEPQSHGLQIEHLKILCNNCVIHSLDILADAVFFESKFISFTSLEKIFAVEVDDDFFADFYFNIGRILPNGSVQKSFYLTNERNSNLTFYLYFTISMFLFTSNAKFCLFMMVKGRRKKYEHKFEFIIFYWKKRLIKFPKVSESPPYALHHIPLDRISIVPSEGVLSPKSDQHFIVKCVLTNGERGHYRAVLSFFIENLPWKSVTKESYVRKVFVNPIHAERVDILLNEIELWVECVPLAVMLQPCIIKITSEKLRCNDEPVLPKITLANITLEDIGFHWIPVSSPFSEPAAASVIEMFVECGTIKTKTFMPCPLKITTLSHGLLLHEISILIFKRKFTDAVSMKAKNQ
ncbi:Uncharacterized protein GBIM_10215 [Gryllus bimaculatus]|nr:Uncharacterized protein GBIM_10215 [Gryllus bimaculatus]